MANRVSEPSRNDTCDELLEPAVLYQATAPARWCCGTKSDANALPTDRNIPDAISLS